jgi:hypothetical protein
LASRIPFDQQAADFAESKNKGNRSNKKVAISREPSAACRRLISAGALLKPVLLKLGDHSMIQWRPSRNPKHLGTGYSVPRDFALQADMPQPPLRL